MVGSSLFLPAGGQLRFGDRFNHVVEQSPDRDAQYGSHSFEHVDCDVFRTALDPTDVGPINISGEGQTFLRKPLLDAQASQIRTDGLPGVHTDAPKHCHGLTGDGLSVPYCAKSHGVEEPMRQVCLPPSAALVRPMTIAALIAALLATSTLATTAQSQGPLPLSMLDEYSGWWASIGAPEACEVTGSPHRVSIGRYEVEAGGTVRFGQGDLRMATPSGDCELYEPEFIDGRVEAIAVCRVEGERQVGRAVFFGQPDEIEVQSPLLRAELVRCGSKAATFEVGTTGQIQIQPPTDLPPVQPKVATELRRSPDGPLNPPDPVQIIEALTGWWRYDNATFGCDDADGMTRTLLGRYDFDDDRELIAGNGPLRFSFYEGECELTDPVFRDGKLAATAMCVSEEEASKGWLTIESVDDTSIVVTSPALNDATLVACKPGQMDGIAALPLPVPASPDNKDAGSANADSATSAPVAESPPQPGHTVVIPPIEEAAHLNPQRNAVVRVIADYCQPDFYETRHWGSGEWDATYYERYERQLLVKYLSSCEAFQREEYLPFTVIDEMLARNPKLFPAGPAQLSNVQASVVGFYLQLKNASEAQQCPLQNVVGDKDGRLWRTLEPLLAKATQGDQFNLAAGYFTALATGTGANAVNPLFGPACSPASLQMMAILQLALGAGLYLPTN